MIFPPVDVCYFSCFIIFVFLNLRQHQTKSPMENFSLSFTFVFSFSCAIAQNVYIPDANFKAALVSNTNINTNMDTEIQWTETIVYTGEIFVENMSISNLTGIEAFPNITSLNCKDNLLHEIDLSQNSNLIQLNCQNNDLNELNLIGNPMLTHLYCSNNLLTALDLSYTPNLIHLDCFLNQLSVLDFSNTLLLEKLNCSMNELTELDLTQQTALTFLNCSNNQLNYLNIANGNNVNIADLPYAFDASDNNLTCITVDDINYSYNNWTEIDPGVSFSLNCGHLATEENMEISQFNVYPNPATNYIYTTVMHGKCIDSFSILNQLGEIVLTVNNPLEQIDISELSEGIYLIRQIVNGKENYSRLVVVR